MGKQSGFPVKTLTCLNLTFESSSTKRAVNCGIESRLAVGEDDLKWVKKLINLSQIVKTVSRKLSSASPVV